MQNLGGVQQTGLRIKGKVQDDRGVEEEERQTPDDNDRHDDHKDGAPAPGAIASTAALDLVDKSSIVRFSTGRQRAICSVHISFALMRDFAHHRGLLRRFLTHVAPL